MAAMTRTCRDCQREAVRYSPYCASCVNRYVANAYASETTKPVWVRRLSKNAKVLTS